ncbi:transcriptional regulator DEF1-like isoform X1 [Olea europaea var. sylvestris]|uniref:transcriptional regulator DEF1-like isoform X1 n=1 Tax=Olea europaea var. sylvestris TaxID=158386 RepID=UPI000C1D6B10|nr:transcriptional regulator DEF1-like isoform X1 [Olea europaea var. sylvestris]
MSCNTTSQLMDKLYMDLVNSRSGNNSSSSNIDLINFMKNQSEDRRKENDIVPSYDFMPVRSAGGSSSRPLTTANIDSGNLGGSPREWNSADSKTNSSSIRNYNSLDVIEPTKVTLEKDHEVINESLVSEIDRTMKKYVDHLMHALDGVTVRLLQLETKTCNLESSMDDLKLSVGDNQRSTDGKLRQMENILREVQIHIIRDKQEIVEAQLQMGKLQVSKVGQQVETHNTSCADSTRTGISTSQNSHQQFPTLPSVRPTSIRALPNAPPPLPSQQDLQPLVQLPTQFPQNQVPSVTQRESYFPPPGQTLENLSQQYQVPPQHQQMLSSPPLQPQSSQPPPPQPHPVLSTVYPSQPQPALGHHHEETQYLQPETYQPSNCPPLSHPSQQFCGPSENMYQPPSSKLTLGFPVSYGQSSGPRELYSYSSSPMKLQQLPSPLMGQNSGSGYPQLPRGQILPHVRPIASGLGGDSGSGGTGNRVPIDDVIDKVTTMGFSRDQVRATVRKLTENGQSVDLNVVLDKLMNDGAGQPPHGWFGQ